MPCTLARTPLPGLAHSEEAPEMDTLARLVRWRRWRLYAVAVDGSQTLVVTRLTRRGAQRAAWLYPAPVPLPGRPLWTMRVERDV